MISRFRISCGCRCGRVDVRTLRHLWGVRRRVVQPPPPRCCRTAPGIGRRTAHSDARAFGDRSSSTSASNRSKFVNQRLIQHIQTAFTASAALPKAPFVKLARTIRKNRAVRRRLPRTRGDGPPDGPTQNVLYGRPERPAGRLAFCTYREHRACPTSSPTRRLSSNCR